MQRTVTKNLNGIHIFYIKKNLRGESTPLFVAGCKEYRKVDSVLRSVEEEERYEFTGGQNV